MGSTLEKEMSVGELKHGYGLLDSDGFRLKDRGKRRVYLLRSKGGLHLGIFELEYHRQPLAFGNWSRDLGYIPTPCGSRYP